MEKFTTRELIKRGWIKREDLNFRDDGTSFRAFEYKNGIIAIYTKDSDYHYLSIRLDYMEGSLNYAEITKLKSYNDCYKYNFCKEIDVDDLCDIADRIFKEYLEKEEEMENKEIDEKLIYDRLLKEKEMVCDVLDKTNLTLDDMEEINEYELKMLKDDRKYLKNMAFGNLEKFENGEFSKSQLRAFEERIKEDGYCSLNGEEYSFKSLKKYMKNN